MARSSHRDSQQKNQGNAHRQHTHRLRKVELLTCACNGKYRRAWRGPRMTGFLKTTRTGNTAAFLIPMPISRGNLDWCSAKRLGSLKNYDHRTCKSHKYRHGFGAHRRNADILKKCMGAYFAELKASHSTNTNVFFGCQTSTNRSRRSAKQLPF